MINSILSSRRAEKNDEQMLETRQAQLFMRIYNRWTSKEMTSVYGLVRWLYTWETPNEAFEKYMPKTDADAYSNHQILHNFYEGLGVLVKRGLIDINLVEDLFSQRIVWHWERFEKLFLRAREITGDYSQYDSMEYLYHEMKHRQRLTTRPEVK